MQTVEEAKRSPLLLGSSRVEANAAIFTKTGCHCERQQIVRDSCAAEQHQQQQQQGEQTMQKQQTAADMEPDSNAGTSTTEAGAAVCSKKTGPITAASATDVSVPLAGATSQPSTAVLHCGAGDLQPDTAPAQPDVTDIQSSVTGLQCSTLSLQAATDDAAQREAARPQPSAIDLQAGSTATHTGVAAETQPRDAAAHAATADIHSGNFNTHAETLVGMSDDTATAATAAAASNGEAAAAPATDSLSECLGSVMWPDSDRGGIDVEQHTSAGAALLATAEVKGRMLREETEETSINEYAASPLIATDGDSSKGEIPCFSASLVSTYFFSPSRSSPTPFLRRQTSPRPSSDGASRLSSNECNGEKNESNSSSSSSRSINSSRSECPSGSYTSDSIGSRSDARGSCEVKRREWDKRAAQEEECFAPKAAATAERNSEEPPSCRDVRIGVVRSTGLSDEPAGMLTGEHTRNRAAAQHKKKNVSFLSTAKDNTCTTRSTCGSNSVSSSLSSPSVLPPNDLSTSSSLSSSASSSSTASADLNSEESSVPIDTDYSAAPVEETNASCLNKSDDIAGAVSAFSPGHGAEVAPTAAAAAPGTAPMTRSSEKVVEAIEAPKAAGGKEGGKESCSSQVDVGAEAKAQSGGRGACSSIEELAALFEPLPTDDLLLESSASTAALTATTLLPASAFLQTELLAGTTMSLPLIVSFLFSLFNGDPKLGLLTPQAKYMAWRSILFLSDMHDGKVSPTDVLGENAIFTASSTAVGAGDSGGNGKNGRFRLPHPHFTRGVQQQLQQMQMQRQQQQQSQTGGIIPGSNDRGAGGVTTGGAPGGGTLHQHQHGVASSTIGESVATSRGKRTVKHAFLSDRFQPSSLQEKGAAATCGSATAATATGGATASEGVSTSAGSGAAGAVTDSRGDAAQTDVGSRTVTAGASMNSSSTASPVKATYGGVSKSSRAGSSTSEGGQQQQQHHSARATGTKRALGRDEGNGGVAAAENGLVGEASSGGGSVASPSTKHMQHVHQHSTSGGVAGGASNAVLSPRPARVGQGGEGEIERLSSQEVLEGRGTESKTMTIGGTGVSESTLQQKQHAAALGEQQIVGYEENFPRFVCGSIDRRWALQQRTVTVYRDEEKTTSVSAGSSNSVAGAAGSGQGPNTTHQQQQSQQQSRIKGKGKEEDKKVFTADADDDVNKSVDAGPLELQFEEIRYSAALHMWPRKTLVPVLPEKISQGLAVQVACTAKVVERSSSGSSKGGASAGGETRVVWRDGEVTKVLQATGDVYVRVQSNHRDYKSVKCSIRDFLHPRVPVTRLKERLWRLRPHAADLATDIYPGACVCISLAGSSLSSGSSVGAATASSTVNSSSSSKSSSTPHAAVTDAEGSALACPDGGAAGTPAYTQTATEAMGKKTNAVYAAPVAGAPDGGCGGIKEQTEGVGQREGTVKNQEGMSCAVSGSSEVVEESAASLPSTVGKSGSAFFVDAVIHQVFFSSEEARETRRRCLAGRSKNGSSTTSSTNKTAVSPRERRRSSGNKEEAGRGSRRTSVLPSGLQFSPDTDSQEEPQQQQEEGRSSCSNGSDSGSHSSSNTRKRSDSSHVGGAASSDVSEGNQNGAAATADESSVTIESAPATAVVSGQNVKGSGRQQRFQLRSSTQKDASGGGGRAGGSTGGKSSSVQGKQQQLHQGSTKQQRWRQTHQQHQQQQQQHHQSSLCSQQTQPQQQGKKSVRQNSQEEENEELACISDAGEVPLDTLVHPLEGLRPDKPVVEVHVLLLGGSCGSSAAGRTYLVEDVIRLSGRQVYKLAYDLHAHFDEKVSVIARRGHGSITPLPRSHGNLRSSTSICATTTLTTTSTNISTSINSTGGRSSRENSTEKTDGTAVRRGSVSGGPSSDIATQKEGGGDACSRRCLPAVFPSARRQAGAFIWVVPRALSHEAAFTAKGRNRGVASDYNTSHYYYYSQQQQQRQQLQLQQKHREQQLMLQQQGPKQLSAASAGSRSVCSSRSTGTNSEQQQRAGSSPIDSNGGSSHIPPLTPIKNSETTSTTTSVVVSPRSSPRGSSDGGRTDTRSAGTGLQQGGNTATSSVAGVEGGVGKTGSARSTGSMGRSSSSSSRTSSSMRNAVYGSGTTLGSQQPGITGDSGTSPHLLSSSSEVTVGYSAAGGCEGVGSSSSLSTASNTGLVGLSGGITSRQPNVSRWESRTRDRAKDWVDYPPFVLCCFRFHPEARFYHRHSQLLRYLQPELDFVSLQRGIWKVKLPLLTESSFGSSISLPPPSLPSAAIAPAIYPPPPSSFPVSSLLLHPSDPTLPLQSANRTSSQVTQRGVDDYVDGSTWMKCRKAAAEGEPNEEKARDHTDATDMMSGKVSETAGKEAPGKEVSTLAQQMEQQQQKRQQRQTGHQGSRKPSNSGIGSPTGERSRRGSSCKRLSSSCDPINPEEVQTGPVTCCDRQQSGRVAVGDAGIEYKQEKYMLQANDVGDDLTHSRSSKPTDTVSSGGAEAGVSDKHQISSLTARSAGAVVDDVATDSMAPAEEEDKEAKLRYLVNHLQARQQQETTRRKDSGDSGESEELVKMEKNQAELQTASSLPFRNEHSSSNSEEICDGGAAAPAFRTATSSSTQSSAEDTGAALGAADISAAGEGGGASSASSKRLDTFERLWKAVAQRELESGSAAAAATGGGKVTTGAGPRGRPWTLKEAREHLWRVWVDECRCRRQQLLRDPAVSRVEEAAEEEALLTSSSSASASSSSRSRNSSSISISQPEKGQNGGGALHASSSRHLQLLQEHQGGANSEQQDTDNTVSTKHQPHISSVRVFEMNSVEKRRLCCNAEDGKEVVEVIEEVKKEEAVRIQSGQCKRRRNEFGAAVPVSSTPTAAYSEATPGLRFEPPQHVSLMGENSGREARRSSIAAGSTEHAEQQGAPPPVHGMVRGSNSNSRSGLVGRLPDNTTTQKAIAASGVDLSSGRAAGAASGDAAAGVTGAGRSTFFTQDPWLATCTTGRGGNKEMQQIGSSETQGLQQKQMDPSAGDGEMRGISTTSGETSSGGAASARETRKKSFEEWRPPRSDDGEKATQQTSGAPSETVRRRRLMHDVVRFLAQRARLSGREWRSIEEHYGLQQRHWSSEQKPQYPLQQQTKREEHCPQESSVQPLHDRDQPSRDGGLAQNDQPTLLSDLAAVSVAAAADRSLKRKETSAADNSTGDSTSHSVMGEGGRQLRSPERLLLRLLQQRQRQQQLRVDRRNTRESLCSRAHEEDSRSSEASGLGGDPGRGCRTSGGATHSSGGMRYSVNAAEAGDACMFRGHSEGGQYFSERATQQEYAGAPEKSRGLNEAERHKETSGAGMEAPDSQQQQRRSAQLLLQVLQQLSSKSRRSSFPNSGSSIHDFKAAAVGQLLRSRCLESNAQEVAAKYTREGEAESAGSTPSQEPGHSNSPATADPDDGVVSGGGCSLSEAGAYRSLQSEDQQNDIQQQSEQLNLTPQAPEGQQQPDQEQQQFLKHDQDAEMLQQQQQQNRRQRGGETELAAALAAVLLTRGDKNKAALLSHVKRLLASCGVAIPVAPAVDHIAAPRHETDAEMDSSSASSKETAYQTVCKHQQGKLCMRDVDIYARDPDTCVAAAPSHIAAHSNSVAAPSPLSAAAIRTCAVVSPSGAAAPHLSTAAHHPSAAASSPSAAVSSPSSAGSPGAASSPSAAASPQSAAASPPSAAASLSFTARPVASVCLGGGESACSSATSGGGGVRHGSYSEWWTPPLPSPNANAGEMRSDERIRSVDAGSYGVCTRDTVDELPGVRQQHQQTPQALVQQHEQQKKQSRQQLRSLHRQQLQRVGLSFSKAEGCTQSSSSSRSASTTAITAASLNVMDVCEDVEKQADIGEEYAAHEEIKLSPMEIERSNGSSMLQAAAASLREEAREQRTSKIVCGGGVVKRENTALSVDFRTPNTALAADTVYPSSSVTCAAHAVPSTSALNAATGGAMSGPSIECTFIADPATAATADSVVAFQRSTAAQQLAASAIQTTSAMSRGQESIAATTTASFPLRSGSTSRRSSCVSFLTGENSPSVAERSSSPATATCVDRGLSRSYSSEIGGSGSTRGSENMMTSSTSVNDSNTKNPDRVYQRKAQHPRSAAAAAAEQLRNLAAAADALPASVADAVQDYTRLATPSPPPAPPRRVHLPVRTPLQHSYHVTSNGRNYEGRKPRSQHTRSATATGKGADGDGGADAHADEEEEDVELPTRQIRKQSTVTHTAVVTASPAIVGGGATIRRRSRRRSEDSGTTYLTRGSNKEKDERVEEKEPAGSTEASPAIREIDAAIAAGDRTALAAHERRTNAARASGVGGLSRGQSLSIDEPDTCASTRESRGVGAGAAAYIEGREDHALGDQLEGVTDTQTEEAAGLVDEVAGDRQAVDRARITAHTLNPEGAATTSQGCAQGRADDRGRGSSRLAAGGAKAGAADRGADAATSVQRPELQFIEKRLGRHGVSSPSAAAATRVKSETILGELSVQYSRGQAEAGRAVVAAVRKIKTRSAEGIFEAEEALTGRRRSSADTAAGQKKRTSVNGTQREGPVGGVTTRPRRSGVPKLSAEDLSVPTSCAVTDVPHSRGGRRESDGSRRESGSGRRESGSSTYRESTRDSSAGVGGSCVTRSSNISRSAENTSNGKRVKTSSSSSGDIDCSRGGGRPRISFSKGSLVTSCSSRRSSRSSRESGKIDDLWEPPQCNSSGSDSESNSCRHTGFARGGTKRRQKRSRGIDNSRDSNDNHAGCTIEGDGDILMGRTRLHVASVGSPTSVSGAASAHDSLQLRNRALLDYAAVADTKRARESVRLPASPSAANDGVRRLQERLNTEQQGTGLPVKTGKQTRPRSDVNATHAPAANRGGLAEATENGESPLSVAAKKELAAADLASTACPPSAPHGASFSKSSAAASGASSSCAAYSSGDGARAPAAAVGAVQLRSPLAGPYSTRHRATAPLLLPAGERGVAGAEAPAERCQAGLLSEETAKDCDAEAAADCPAAAGVTGNNGAKISMIGDRSKRTVAEKKRRSFDVSPVAHAISSAKPGTAADTAQQKLADAASPSFRSQPGGTRMSQQQLPPPAQPQIHFWQVSLSRETRSSAGKRHLSELPAHAEQQDDLDGLSAAPDAGAAGGRMVDGDEEVSSIRTGWRRSAGGAVTSHFKGNEGTGAAATSVVPCTADDNAVQHQEDEQLRRSKRVRRGGPYTAKAGAGMWGR